ncbi:hypothetical protein IscW_ISCW022042 [Ixodes scapularis]|uniref:Uncharacterized protein n=1 Tax=Ixodes scapularis TaxID=6945 RepID=B7QFP6_IXOSC|nr:hypothetical protein IscW_ISCW022042 [Ixodes scapularis]|eukprot:XP_002414360.1 hypothetical protein IscW_ISCW022042 [Ixodes scapularis]
MQICFYQSVYPHRQCPEWLIGTRESLSSSCRALLHLPDISRTPESASIVCALEWVANVASAYLSGSTYVRSPVNSPDNSSPCPRRRRW